MTPFFLNLKDSYTSYLLHHVSQFKHIYSIRIYELCRQYYPRIGSRKIEIDRLKLLLSIPEKKYRNYANFKKYVIEPSVAEINQYSDIELTFEPEKRGRKYDSITFTISKNKNQKELETFPKVEEVAIEVVGSAPSLSPAAVGSFPNWINANQRQILVKRFGGELVRAGIEAIELKGDEVKNPRSYLMKGLQEGWFSAPAEQAKPQGIQKRRDEAKEALEVQEQIIREFDARRNDFLKALTIDEESIEMFVFQHLESEESYLRKMAGQISRGGRAELAMKRVAVWMVNEEPGDYTEEELMLANADVRGYAMRAHGHHWVG